MATDDVDARARAVAEAIEATICDTRRMDLAAWTAIVARALRAERAAALAGVREYCIAEGRASDSCADGERAKRDKVRVDADRIRHEVATIEFNSMARTFDEVVRVIDEVSRGGR